MGDQRKHHFTEGYTAPISREKREAQLKLVNKYFQREKKSTENLKQKIIDKAEKLQGVYAEEASKTITREEALVLGEARRREALMRREEHVKNQVSRQQVESTGTFGQSSTATSFDQQMTESQMAYYQSHHSSSLKAMPSPQLTRAKENNTTAIGFKQFLGKKGDFKSLQKEVKETNGITDIQDQIVYAKEFKKKNKIEVSVQFSSLSQTANTQSEQEQKMVKMEGISKYEEEKRKIAKAVEENKKKEAQAKKKAEEEKANQLLEETRRKEAQVKKRVEEEKAKQLLEENRRKEAQAKKKAKENNTTAIG